MRKQNNQEYDATIKVTTLTKIMIIVGLLGLVLSNSIVVKHTIWSIVIQIVNVVSSALFSAGLVSIVVEISTIKGLVSDAFKKILTGDFETDGLSDESLSRIKYKISAAQLNTTEQMLANTVYKYEDNLLRLAESKYYEYHKITYHITPDESKNCFHVKAKITHRIINNKLIDNFYEMRLKLYNTRKDLTIEQYKKEIKLLQLKINGIDIDTTDIISIENICHNTESTYYDYKILIHKDLEEANNKVEAVLQYDVPINDIDQTFRISSPCKNLEHKFYIVQDVSTGANWSIKANAFSTFFHRQREEESNYVVEQNVDTALTIKYTDWALVGNGYTVYFQKK